MLLIEKCCDSILIKNTAPKTLIILYSRSPGVLLEMGLEQSEYTTLSIDQKGSQITSVFLPYYSTY